MSKHVSEYTKKIMDRLRKQATHENLKQMREKLR